MYFSPARKAALLLTLISLLASVLGTPRPVYAQDASAAASDVLQISTQAQDTLIRYATGSMQVSAADAARQLPAVHYQGYQLPMQFLTVAVNAEEEPTITLRSVTAAALETPPQPAPVELPPAIGWEADPNYVPDAAALPAQPVFIAREGLVRGQRFAVVAVSPIFEQGGVAQIITSMEATVAGATPAAGGLPAAGAAGLQAAAAPAAVQVPVNTAALTAGFKLIVAQPGIQEVLYNELGLAAEPANVRLTLNGQQVAVEKDGDRLRFYAPQVGDRWNDTTTYWLTFDKGLTMQQRPGAPAGPKLGAYQQGLWQDNRLYEPAYPGADGDHWFHSDLKAPALLAPGAVITQITPVTVPVQTTLPRAGGATTFQVTATAYLIPTSDQYCNYPYQLHVQGLQGANLVATQVVSWLAHPDCRRQTSGTAVMSSTAPITSLQVRLNPNGYYPSGIKLESVTWQRPVKLDFRSQPGGAEFYTDAGAGSLQLQNLPASWRLYDVTNTNRPQVVASGSGGDYTLNQAAGAPAGRYVLVNLAGTGTSGSLYLPLMETNSDVQTEDSDVGAGQAAVSLLQKPTVQVHPAVQFGDVRAADAIYIGPAQFGDELAPLLALRQQQGFVPLFVDVQAVYDVYGYGQVSAVALRNFLRQQSDWQNNARQISVVLAGDATIDPHGYGGLRNDTLVAAWVDNVDPYQGAGEVDGEAACDACIAQLDGDDPVTGDGRNWFTADVWIGRLPVRNEQELAAVVEKLVNYDTNNNDSDTWRMRQVFLADNYIKKVDAQQNIKPDEAGDFAALSDNIVRLLPSLANVRRLYYDPLPGRQLALSPAGTPIPAGNGYFQTEPRTIPENWRIADIVGINTDVITALSDGAGLVIYNGHSNHFYYGRTEDVYNTGIGDKWLLNAPEVSLLGNYREEFMMLSMTCYTSQFVKPTENGTLDEWLIRHPNAGAVAVWGPTGLSVVSGHDLLQRGFMEQLVNPTGRQRIGSLLEAGYTYLLTQNGPLDPLMTFVLLGDPLTAARMEVRSLYMPAIVK